VDPFSATQPLEDIIRHHVDIHMPSSMDEVKQTNGPAEMAVEVDSVRKDACAPEADRAAQYSHVQVGTSLESASDEIKVEMHDAGPASTHGADSPILLALATTTSTASTVAPNPAVLCRPASSSPLSLPISPQIRLDKGKGKETPSRSPTTSALFDSARLSLRHTSPSTIFEYDRDDGPDPRTIASTSRLYDNQSPSSAHASPPARSASLPASINSSQRSAASSPRKALDPVTTTADYVNEFGRSFRNRTAAQLNPYAMEQAKYARSLAKNGWADAVVKFRRPAEDSAADLTRKKEHANLAAKDGLGGWLEYEEGQKISERTTRDIMAESDEDSELDGEEFLRRQELKAVRVFEGDDERRRRENHAKYVGGTDGESRHFLH
jgi:hypothetical protein